MTLPTNPLTLEVHTAHPESKEGVHDVVSTGFSATAMSLPFLQDAIPNSSAYGVEILGIKYT